MKRLLLLLLAFTFTASPAFAQPLPPPQNPDGEQQDKVPPLPPQNVEQASAGPKLINPAPSKDEKADAAKPKKNPGKPPEYFAARRQAQIARKQAAKDRMRQFQAARAAWEEKRYQDWHERYVADAPVRVEYYRALADAYRADAALAYERAFYFNYWYPPVYYPPVYYPYAPFYGPAYPAPIYGIYVGW